MTKKSASKLAKIADATNALAEDTPAQVELLEGLTEQQHLIARLKLRGLSQKAIAQLLEVTPARISQEVSAIRKHFQDRGSSIDQSMVVGETVTLYEEVERKAWEVYHEDKDKRLRALDTVMSARERHLKLLMDLGLIKRAAIEHTHDIAVSPALARLTPEKRQAIVAHIVETRAGDEPTPPTDDDDGDFYDVEDEDSG